MKYKQNQDIDSFGVISVFLFIGLCLMVSVPIWNRSKNANFAKTMHRAENLAYQIIEARDPSRLASLARDRSLASVPSSGRFMAESGEISRDLWGQPFRFQVLRQDSTGLTRVLVWSLGPNGHADTTEQNFKLNQDIQVFQFAGDDVGAMVFIK